MGIGTVLRRCAVSQQLDFFLGRKRYGIQVIAYGARTMYRPDTTMINVRHSVTTRAVYKDQHLVWAKAPQA
jgi:hypothetical protein